MQRHLEEAIKAVRDNQDAKDKVLKWQEERHRWAHYVVIRIRGHRNIRTSSYSEQNHSSQAQRVPDDATRPVEQFLVELLHRTDDVLNERQVKLFEWEAGSETAIRKLNPSDRKHLADARRLLHREPYHRFAAQVGLYPSYNVKEVANGCELSHTSSPDKVYFIPDGERCSCDYVFCWEDECRHEIAKRIHRGLPAFDLALFSPLHRFQPVLPMLKAAPSTSVIMRPRNDKEENANPGFEGDNNEQSASGEFEGHLDGSLALQPEPVQYGNLGLPAALVANSEQPAASATKKRKVPGQDSQLSQIAISPSKGGSVEDVRPDHRAKRRKSCNINANVSYGNLRDACTALSSLASSMDNAVQNAVLTHIVKLKTLLDTRDYGSLMHKGTSVEAMAMQLNYLVGVGVQAIRPGHVVVKSSVPREGANPTNRLGGPKSQKGRTPQMCGFCSSVGEHPGNQTICPKKLAFGTCFAVKKDKHAITEKLEMVTSGKDDDFIDLSGNELLSNCSNLSGPPGRAKRIQIKGYKTMPSGKRYLLCTCIDRFGNSLSQQEGRSSVSYQDVFVEYMATVASLGQYDSIFFKPLDQNSLETADLKLSGGSDETGFDGSGDHCDSV